MRADRIRQWASLAVSPETALHRGDIPLTLHLLTIALAVSTKTALHRGWMSTGRTLAHSARGLTETALHRGERNQDQQKDLNSLAVSTEIAFHQGSNELGRRWSELISPSPRSPPFIEGSHRGGRVTRAWILAISMETALH